MANGVRGATVRVLKWIACPGEAKCDRFLAGGVNVASVIEVGVSSLVERMEESLGGPGGLAGSRVVSIVLSGNFVCVGMESIA